MRANETRPAGTGSEADGPKPILPASGDVSPLIGATVEKPLDATLWRLVNGEIGLHDLTPALVGFYAIGFEHGRESIRPELERAQNDADTYYERWTNPTGPELADVRMRRMRQAAEDYWEQLIAEPIDGVHAVDTVTGVARTHTPNGGAR